MYLFGSVQWEAHLVGAKVGEDVGEAEAEEEGDLWVLLVEPEGVRCDSWRSMRFYWNNC